MRNQRTTEEEMIIQRIKEPLNMMGFSSFKIDESVVDRPDIVFESSGKRIGVEISRLDYEAYCKFINHQVEPPYLKTSEITINLEKLLGNVLGKKNKDHKNFIKERNLDECWLVLHNDVFEFKDTKEQGVLSKDWFEKYSHLILQEKGCLFERVLFNLEHPGGWSYLFNKSERKKQEEFNYKWPVMTCHQGVINVTEPKSYKIDIRKPNEKKRFY